MIRTRQRRATIKKKKEMASRRERDLRAFGVFLADFIRDLNGLSFQGWALLVEGKRDVIAVRRLGYKGRIGTVSSVGRMRGSAFWGSKKVVILTDLDREGALLAARHIKRLTHEGIRTSLAERRRLKAASKGVFLHIENLSRFGDVTELINGKQEFISTRISAEPKLS